MMQTDCGSGSILEGLDVHPLPVSGANNILPPCGRPFLDSKTRYPGRILMARQKVRLVAYAWGRTHVEDLLEFTLSAALAPGNLPALVSIFDCSAVLVMEEKLFGYVRSHPIVKKLERICPVELVPLDDLVSDPWQYGMTVTYALFRGFADLGPKMTDTYILFLNADFILADGCYERLIPHIRSGERVHLAPSYCTVAEELRPLLREAKSRNRDVLAIAPREMAELILAYPHNTIRTKTVNQSVFDFDISDQFYWKVDPHTLIGHQMPIALVGMRPERALADLTAFWDWGIVYEFCPSKQLTVIGDSDDFLMMELRSKDRSIESISFGRSSPKRMARRLMVYITEYPVDKARFELVLESRALSSNLRDARRQLRAHVDEVLGQLPRIPSYRRHREWFYHLRHFRRRLEYSSIRSRIMQIRSRVGRAERYLIQERKLIDEHLSDKGRKRALQYLEAEYAERFRLWGQQMARLEAQLQTSIRSGNPIRQRIAGAGLAYRVSRHQLRKWIRQMGDDHMLRILAVCPIHSLLLGILEPVTALQVHLTPEAVANGALGMLPQAGADFDVCLLELIDVGPRHARQLLDAVAERLKRPGTILVHWHDRGAVPLRSFHNQIVQFTLDRAYHASAHYAGSWASTKAAEASGWWPRGAPRWRRLGLLACLPAVTILAELRERTRKKQAVTMPKYCSSATFQIELPAGQPADPMKKASLGSKSQNRPFPKTRDELMRELAMIKHPLDQWIPQRTTNVGQELLRKMRSRRLGERHLVDSGEPHMSS